MVEKHLYIKKQPAHYLILLPKLSDCRDCPKYKTATRKMRY